ncbi:hypothetical protein [Streptomyces cadmiisoli]|nr:hypothetical protein [Streptomyces cadmiisoli]
MPGSPEQEAEWDREAEKVYRLVLAGHNLQAISRHFNITREVARRRIARARRNLGEDALADMRLDIEAGLDELVRRSYRNLQDAETVMERNSIIRTIADLKAKKSKLLGLDMPSKVTLEMEQALQLLHTQPDPVWGAD